MKPRTVSALCLLVSGLSGTAGLGLQLTWTRRFALGLGHEFPAALAVLTAFFAGFAGGAWLLERWIAGSRHPLRWAAGLELVIGGWALATVPLLPIMDEAVLRMTGAEPSASRQWAVCFAVPLLALLPATMAMGATLSAMVRASGSSPGMVGHVGGLYAANTAGAVAGVVAAVVWAQPALGLRGATCLFAGLNLACAAMLAAMARTPSSGSSRPLPRRGTDGERSGDPTSSPRLVATLAVTGLLGLGLEVVVTRQLALVLEGTVFTFAAVLVVFLGGTALGAALAGNAKLPTGRLLLWLGVAVLAAGHALTHAIELDAWLRGVLGDGLGAVCVAEATVAASILGAPTLLMGATFARLAQSAAESGFGTGRAVAVNTLGGAFAAPVFAVALLPALGAKATFMVLGAGYLALAVRRLDASTIPGMMIAVVVAATLPADFGLLPPPPGARLVERRDGAADTVAVWGFPDGNLTLAANGRFTMGGTASTNAAARHTLLPLLLHPHPRRLLFLGLGTGISFAAAGAEPGLVADGVELVPEVVAVQPRFAPHNALASGQRVVAADARRFVRTTTASYDVVVADLFHPARDGAASLYTREQFAAMRARLAPGGMAVQWLPLYQLDAAGLRQIVRAFLDVFPHMHAWLLRFNADTPVIGLVGWPEAPAFGPDDLDRRAPEGPLRTRAKSAGLTDAFQVHGAWLAGPEALRAFAGDAVANTDDRPGVLFSAPRSAASKRGDPSGLLMELVDRFAGEGSEFPAVGAPAGSAAWRSRLSDFRAARDAYLRGLVAEGAGRADEAADQFMASVRRSGDFSAGYAQLLTRAMTKAKSDPAEAKRRLRALTEARPGQKVAAELLRRLE